MADLPGYISLVFSLTVAATLGFILYGFRSAESQSPYSISTTVLVLIIVWMTSIGWLSQQEFFENYNAFPPRLFLVIVPMNILIIASLLLKKSRTFLMKIPISTMTYIHIIRVPVEITLWWLADYEVAPYLITFEGINYDILSGVTAPFAAIFLVSRKGTYRTGAIIWNFAALVLLAIVVYHAILSTPSPFQCFSFDQPLTAVFHMPFIWLPGFVVPAVLFSHLVSLVKLFNSTDEDNY